MNKHFFLIGMLVVILLVGGCTSEPENKEPITIGIDVFPGWAHAFIAEEKGLFEKNGVVVELVMNEDYLIVQEQFENKEIDGAFMVFADAIYTNDQGIGTRVVYISDQSIEGDAIVAKPEIKSVEDLKGKTIGVEGINSFSHLFVLSVLEKNGMKEGDVFIKNVGAQDVVEALQNDEIVAGHTYGPEKFEAAEKGFTSIAYAGDVPGIITDVLAFNAGVVAEKPEEIKAVVKSLFEAKEFQKTNRDESLHIIASAIGDTRDSVEIGIGGVKYLDLEENERAMQDSELETQSLVDSGRLIGEFFLVRGQISSAPDLDEVIEISFVRDLKTETN